MFAKIIEIHLGKYGSLLLDFLLANYIAFNLLILGYGLVLIVAYRNFTFVSETLIQKMETENLTMEDVSDMLKRDRNYWNSLKSQLKIPIITGRSSFLLYSLTAENVITVMQKRIGTKNERN